MTNPNPANRPQPLRQAARWYGGMTALLAGLVGSGLISAGLGEAINGVITALVVLLGTLGIVVTTEPKVTPLSDPRDDVGGRLVPADPSGFEL